MGNKIRIKQIDLQGIFSASNQVDILSASNYAQFVTQLDTTMSSDSELAAVSSSISQSIYTINRVIGSGLISGSSQLTSSYDSRYVLSGSITQTTWDNISGKPAGIVSQSTDLTSLNAFTASNGTTQLNLATSSYETKGRDIVSGSSQLTASYDTRYETKGSGILSGSVSYTSLTNIPSGIVSQSVSLSSLNAFTSSYFTDSASIDSRVLTEKGRIDAILSASNANTDTFAEIVALINSVDTTNDNSFATFYTSSNARISSLENATGSYLTSLNGALSSSSQLTSSFDVRYTLSGSVQPLPSGLVSGSSQLTSSFDSRYTLSGSSVNINTGSFATTGSNTFSGSQVITGSLIVSSIAVVNGGINVPTGSTLSLTSGSNIFVDSSGGITGSFSGSVFGIGDVIAFSASLNNRILSGSSSIPAGTVSGSSQLTASYDTRYTLSGSIGATPAGTISGSSQLTASFDARYLNTDGDNVISGSSQLTSSYDTRYALSSSLSSISSSFNGRFNGLVTTGSNTFSGSQVFSGSMTVTSGQVIASTITNNSSSLYLQSGSNLYVQNNGIVEITGSIILNGTTYTSLTGSGAIPAGTISGSSQLTASYDLRYEGVGRGIVSGSSQLTSSFDTRYTLSGSVQPLPSGVISGSSQLTSSFVQFSDTASLNVYAAGLVNLSTTNTTIDSTLYPIFTNNIVNANTQLRNHASGTFYYDGVARKVYAESFVGSIEATNGIVSGSTQLTSSFETRGSGIYSSSAQLPSGLISGSSQLPNGLISGSSQLTASYDTRYALSGSGGTIPAGTISGSSQLTSSFDTRYLNTDGDGVISGSSQLTSSFDTRYALSGSGGGTIPAGTISGSSQLTSSLDLRYLVTGSVTSSINQLNTFTASNANTSLNSYTASNDTKWNVLGALTSSFATTGSNQFNGNQVITGSLTITTGSFIGSQITANTSSLYLTSGSNLYLQNSGIAEITGSLLLSGSMTIQSGSITMPDRPAFRVVGTGGGIGAVRTLSGSLYTTDFVQGSGWDVSTGTFTAPIAGLYQVNLVTRTNSNSYASATQFIVYKNNTGGVTGTPQIMIEYGANTSMNHTGGSTISKLAVGDTLKVVLAVGSGSFDSNDNFSVAYIG